ncbi:lysine-specific histone demethylase 1-like protein 1-like [Iris pallida]|uniref:Lysine-specific histone demethylase 1-like protein 1-like n=1 Tax=Iris pallida TaxID=29817 RepID=A0AAX6F671_IRIPA|nr:lysine-specific histone demethylase 1-like protein 1-like [Iris pallida]
MEFSSSHPLMEIPSQSTPPLHPSEIPSQSTPLPPPSSTGIPSQSAPPETEILSRSAPPQTEMPSQSTPTDSETTPPRKRRRRKKQFPGMIPSSRALRELRSHPSRPSVVYNEKLLDRLLESQINQPSSSSSRRGGRRRQLANDLTTESLIAAAVGFPIDSLTEEEIESNVVPVVGNPQSQSNYITIRNHILSLFRSDPSSFLTEPQSAASIRSEHRALVSKAYHFLHSHAYINFGLLLLPPSIPPLPFASTGVVIIGSGLAGLAAAWHLQSQGFRVILLEGRRRPGGRVLTKKMTGPGSVHAAADLGGSVLTGINGNPLGVLARQLGFPLHKVRDMCPLYLPDGKPVDPDVDSKVEVAFNQLLDKACKLRQAVLEEMRDVDASLGTALEAFRKAYGVGETAEERMLLNWHLANLEYANATKLADLSMAFWDQDDPYEMGGDHCFIPGGNGRFVKALAEGVPIFYDRTVSRVHYGCDGVMVYANGQVFRGDMALCTVPLGVLKKGSIQFVPELPLQKQDAIKRLGFGLLNKVAMLFPHDFWGGEIDTFGHLTEESSQRGEFFLFYSYSSVSGGPLLVALVAGESAIKFEKVSPVESAERVLDVLRGIFSPKGIEVPKPLQVICTRWGSDKFTYGSYSYVGIGSSGDDYDVLAESVGDGRVFFAGEATNRRYPATMHGALLSGYREAANISRAARRRSLMPATDKMDVRVDVLDLDDLFKNPDLSFGNISVLYDLSSDGPDSPSLVRVIDDSKAGSGSSFLYGLISRKNVKELHEVEGDEKRLSVLYQNYGTKLVGRSGLGSLGEAIISRIKAGRRVDDKMRIANGLCHV